MADADTTTHLLEIQQRYRKVGRKPGKARPHNPQKPCQFDGCEGWAWAQGYCDNHYQKLKREGVIRSKRIVNDPVARFHNSYKVNEVTGCWEWTGWIHPKGYGILVIGGQSKKIRAHRFSFELHYGPIPDGMKACHKCDNRKCSNPLHLFLGTHEDNMQDMVAKGRHAAQIGTAGFKITPPMAQYIRIMFARGTHSMVGLALIYGVDHSTISAIVRGRAHLG